MKKIRWGLLSTANINRRLIPAIRTSRRGELVAVASRDQSSATSYAEKWGIPLAFGSYQSMLDSGKVDVVYISLPNHLHAEWSIRAMQAGVHVLCEKPFALSLDEVDRMIDASRQTGCVLAEAFMYRHHPQMKLAGEMVHSAQLGQISLVRGIFNFKLENPSNVRMIPEFGGGCLWDVGVYPVSFAQYIYGGLPEVAYGTQFIGNTGVDETFIGEFRYPGGGVAQISSSFRSPFYTFVEVHGSSGILTISHPFTQVEESKMIFTPASGKPQRINFPKKELYLGEVEDMHAAILERSTPYISLDETRNHVQTILALYESARLQKPIYLQA